MASLTRRMSLILCLLVISAASANEQKKLTPVEAKDHFGETATVCGEVVSTRFANTSNGEPTFLNLDKPYPNQVFTVVIWGSNRSKFEHPRRTTRGSIFA